MKQWYTHLIKIESVIIELDKMDLSKEEKLHLAHLVDSSLHHTILDAILSELSDEDKVVFINHLKADDHDKIWKFLNEKADGVEDKIKKVAEDLKSQLHEDIKKALKQVR